VRLPRRARSFADDKFPEDKLQRRLIALWIERHADNGD